MNSGVRIFATGCLIAVLLGLTACVPGGGRPDVTTSGRAQGGVLIHAPEGPPGPMAELLAQSVAAALTRRGYVARATVKGAKDGDDSVADFSVSGAAEALDPIHAPTVAALHWILYDRAGKEIAYLTQGVRGDPDSWAYGSPAMLKIIGDEAAADFSVFLGQPPKTVVTAPDVAPSSVPDAPVSVVSDTQTLGHLDENSTVASKQATASTAPLPAPPTPPPLPVGTGRAGKRAFGLWLDDVTGAPGDGNVALTQALYAGLKQKMLPFALTPGLASHYIQGVVDVSVLSATQEHVTIVWIVSNADGHEIGRVSQRNDIARGSLHGNWGETATYAAGGGLEGILSILERDLESTDTH